MVVNGAAGLTLWTGRLVAAFDFLMEPVAVRLG